MEMKSEVKGIQHVSSQIGREPSLEGMGLVGGGERQKLKLLRIV